MPHVKVATVFRNYSTGLSIILLCALLAGCARTDGIRHYNAYQGEPLAGDVVAHLHIPWEIKVGKIDGEGRYYPLLETLTNPYHGAHIRLLPGTHSLELNYHFPGYESSHESTTVNWRFGAGRHYSIKPTLKTVNRREEVTYQMVPLVE